MDKFSRNAIIVVIVVTALILLYISSNGGTTESGIKYLICTSESDYYDEEMKFKYHNNNMKNYYRTETVRSNGEMTLDDIKEYYVDLMDNSDFTSYVTYQIIKEEEDVLVKTSFNVYDDPDTFDSYIQGLSSNVDHTLSLNQLKTYLSTAYKCVTEDED